MEENKLTLENSDAAKIKFEKVREDWEIKMVEKMDRETREQIQELQLLQQRAQIFAAQKQQYQMQVAEVETALKEIHGTQKPVYKMVGNMLVEKRADEVKKELSVIQEELQIKIKNLEKQEDNIRKKLTDVQKDVTKKIK